MGTYEVATHSRHILDDLDVELLEMGLWTDTAGVENEYTRTWFYEMRGRKTYLSINIWGFLIAPAHRITSLRANAEKV